MHGAPMGFQQADGGGPARGTPLEPPASPDRASPVSRFVCVDPVSKVLAMQIDALAARHTTVLIAGESGVGKERVAQEIHNRSPRADGPFIAVDCSSFSETLIESQLFGHIRGAFTGAEGDRPGYVRAAHGGTLFLDEVGDMPLSLQTRLLRVLQERSVIPVGQTEPIPVNVRILAASNRDLPALVRAAQFREDLFYRLTSFRLEVPPLRERRGDIVPLAEYFLDLQSAIYEEPHRRLSDRARRWLEDEWWRGNVRELANAVEYALVTCDRDVLTPEDFPEPILTEGGLGVCLTEPAYPPTSQRVMTLRQAEWQAVMAALRVTGGDKTNAARALAISRSRLYSILARQEQAGRPSKSRPAS